MRNIPKRERMMDRNVGIADVAHVSVDGGSRKDSTASIPTSHMAVQTNGRLACR